MEKPPIVRMLRILVSYNLLEMISMLTVSPFLIYPVVPVMTSLIYKTHLSTLAKLYAPVERPAIVALEEV